MWDQVNSTMKDVEDSLIKGPVSSTKSKPLIGDNSPSGSPNSAMTISTPEQSLSSLSPFNTDDEGVYINADDIVKTQRNSTQLNSTQSNSKATSLG